MIANGRNNIIPAIPKKLTFAYLVGNSLFYFNFIPSIFQINPEIQVDFYSLQYPYQF